MELEILVIVKEYFASLEEGEDRITVKGRITKPVDDNDTFYYETDKLYKENGTPMSNTASVRNSFEEIEGHLFRYFNEFQTAINNGNGYADNKYYK
jgi:hypothetical protein